MNYSKFDNEHFMQSFNHIKKSLEQPAIIGQSFGTRIYIKEYGNKDESKDDSKDNESKNNKDNKDNKDNSKFSMDCPHLVQISNGNLLSVFHVTGKGEEGHSALWLAIKDLHDKDPNIAIGDDWRALHNLSKRGSMGFIKEYNGKYYICYELENKKEGNTIAIREYQNENDLLNNLHKYQVELAKWVDTAKYEDRKEKAKNIGTPIIIDIQHKKITLRFHYAVNGENDTPGKGQVFLPGQHSKDYQWTAQKWIEPENCIIHNGGKGKIGGRDLIKYNNYYFYLFEAQLSDDKNTESDERWKSWRIFLWSPNNYVYGQKLDIKHDGIVAFANPHCQFIKYDDDIKLVLTFFIPDQDPNAGSKGKAGSYISIINFKQ